MVNQPFFQILEVIMLDKKCNVTCKFPTVLKAKIAW